MSDSHRYVFRTEWRVSASPDAVYAALADVSAYPQWWPEVRATRELGDGVGEIRCRSMLPYDLVFVASRIVEDPVGRVLRAELDGDLIGTSEWTLIAQDGATVAVFDEDVRVGKAAVRVAGRLARPVLRFNHDRMMRSGERGLRDHLA